MFRWHVVSAVFWRNVKQYFSGPLGYLFIVVFVTVCAVMAFSPQFFADNLANLDQLSRWYPVLLLFFIPAITMTVWADEKRQGTDSILFTLPASDFDILIGKYLAVSAVYTIALLFSLTQLIVLQLIGNPDWGVILTTYLGYWLAGLALLAVGMFASSLTKSATVAFVLGAILCSVPVLIGEYFRGVLIKIPGPWDVELSIERLGFDWNLRDFTIGLVPFGNVIYFLSLIVFMLYLNLVVISRRHWYRGEQLSLGGQYLIRSISLGVALIAFCFLCNTAVSSIWSRADFTSEKLYTLHPATIATLEKVKSADRAVTIQAFISPKVPRKYVTTKTQFIGLLRQFSEYGGANVTVRFVDVEPKSQAALEAQQSGIEPQLDRSEVGGRTVEQKVYLGALISTSLGDVAVPFVGNDTSIEYELSRAIATTIDKEQQITLGILDTDLFFGGPELDGRRIDWPPYLETMTELKKQFKIKYIKQPELADYVQPESPDDKSKPDDAAAEAEQKDKQQESKTKTPPNVLLVADPSSLDDQTLDNLIKYLEAGNPAIIMADPLPFTWTYQHPTQLAVFNAPRQPRALRSPYRDVITSSQLPKSDNGTASRLLKALGIEWDNGAAAWSLFNPHPNFNGQWPIYLGENWPEYYGPYEKAFVFVRDHGEVNAFNKDSVLSNGLRELLMFYPGSIRKSVDSKLEFTPLVQLGTDSGITPWDRLTETPIQPVRSINPRTGEMTVDNRAPSSQITMEDLVVIRRSQPTLMDSDNHIVAARVKGTGENKIDVVFITDVDFVSQVYYEQEAALDPQEQNFDNLAFLQNAIEVLDGNDQFVSLRNRRSSPRTLVKLEKEFEQFRSERAKEQELAEKEMTTELEAEQKKLNEATKEIQENESLDWLQKLQRTSQEASDAQRRFDLRKRKLENELEERIDKLSATEEQRISGVEDTTRYTSIIAAPLPALLLGIIVLWWRYSSEQRDITPERRVEN